VDAGVGFAAEVKIGDRVDEGATLGLLYCRDEEQAAEAGERIRAAYTLGDAPPAEAQKLIKEVITE
ncbi:MAG: hypothetical protein ACRD68_15565, partial [Pyrinomonadaceae bacterium]